MTSTLLDSLRDARCSLERADRLLGREPVVREQGARTRAVPAVDPAVTSMCHAIVIEALEELMSLPEEFFFARHLIDDALGDSTIRLTWDALAVHKDLAAYEALERATGDVDPFIYGEVDTSAFGFILQQAVSLAQSSRLVERRGVFLDLGCGAGRGVLVAAFGFARRFETALGIELLERPSHHCRLSQSLHRNSALPLSILRPAACVFDLPCCLRLVGIPSIFTIWHCPRGRV
jgi:hypothetical protein